MGREVYSVESTGKWARRLRRGKYLLGSVVVEVIVQGNSKPFIATAEGWRHGTAMKNARRGRFTPGALSK